MAAKKKKKATKKRAPPAPAPKNVTKRRTKKPLKKKVDKRDAKGKFAIGNCANPAGRPKNSLDLIATLRDVLREEGYDKVDKKDKAKEVLRRLVRNAILASKDGDATSAINSILDRVHGKPAQTVHTSTTQDPYDFLTDAQIDEYLAAKIVDDLDEDEEIS